MGIRSGLIDFSVRVRTGLIGNGLGQTYFQRSRNPVVRATAFCTNLSSQTSIRQLAMAIMTDCLQGNDIHEPAAAVYQHHLAKYRLDGRESNSLAITMLEIAEAKNDLLLSVAVSNLIRQLNLC